MYIRVSLRISGVLDSAHCKEFQKLENKKVSGIGFLSVFR
jgi:hypothetical protein